MDKPLIKVYKAQEYLDLIERLRCWLFNNRADPFGVRSNIVLSNKEPKKIDFYSVKLAFAKLIEEVILT